MGPCHLHTCWKAPVIYFQPMGRLMLAGKTILGNPLWKGNYQDHSPSNLTTNQHQALFWPNYSSPTWIFPEIAGDFPSSATFWGWKLVWGRYNLTRNHSLILDIPPWKLTCPPKRDHFNRKYIFQPLSFRGHSFVFVGVFIAFYLSHDFFSEYSLKKHI